MPWSSLCFLLLLLLLLFLLLLGVLPLVRFVLVASQTVCLGWNGLPAGACNLCVLASSSCGKTVRDLSTMVILEIVA